MEEENLNKAENYFKQIVEKDEKNRIGWLFLGFVYSDMDSLNKAAENYRHALKHLPEDPYILSYYGLTLGRQGKDEDAIPVLEKALSIDPENLTALLPYGLSLSRLGRSRDAIIPFRKALELDNKNLTAISNLGLIYDELKMYSASDSLYENALQAFPNNDLFLNNYSYSLADRGIRLEYALQMALKAIELQPDNGAYLDTVGWVYFRLGQYELARQYIQKSLERRPESAVVTEHLGDVYWKMGDLDSARKYWREALEKDSSNEALKQKLEQN